MGLGVGMLVMPPAGMSSMRTWSTWSTAPFPPTPQLAWAHHVAHQGALFPHPPGGCSTLPTKAHIQAQTTICRFLANGWPISTTTNQGLGLQLKQLIMTTAATMGSSDTAKLASGLLDTWEAIQHVPINPSGTSTSDSGSGFGDSTTTPATPEEDNPFASNTATQSQEFQAAAGVAPSASMTPVPASAADTLIGTAIRQGAAAALNTSVNSSQPVFGSAQPVVFTPSGDALAPTTSPLDDALYHIEAPKAAPGMQGAPDAAPAPEASAADLAASAADLAADASDLAADVAELAAAVQSFTTKGAGRKVML